MNENEMTHSEFYGNMPKEQAELRLALAMSKATPCTGNDFSARRQPVNQVDTGIAPGIHETPNGTVINATDDTIVIPAKVMEDFIKPAQLNQCDVPDPRIVKMPTMFEPPAGGYKRDQLVTMVGKAPPRRTTTSLNAILLQKALAKDVVQADGSQNYLKLRNKRR